MRVNMNKTKVLISGERQKAARWPCGVCGRGVGILVIQYNVCRPTSYHEWVHRRPTVV